MQNKVTVVVKHQKDGSHDISYVPHQGYDEDVIDGLDTITYVLDDLFTYAPVKGQDVLNTIGYLLDSVKVEAWAHSVRNSQREDVFEINLPPSWFLEDLKKFELYLLQQYKCLIDFSDRDQKGNFKWLSNYISRQHKAKSDEINVRFLLYALDMHMSCWIE